MMRSYAMEPATRTFDICADSITHLSLPRKPPSCGWNAALLADGERSYFNVPIARNAIREIRDERDVSVFVLHDTFAIRCLYFGNIECPAENLFLRRQLRNVLA